MMRVFETARDIFAVIGVMAFIGSTRVNRDGEMDSLLYLITAVAAFGILLYRLAGLWFRF